MKFSLRVSDSRGVPWDEPYDKPGIKTLDEARRFAEQLIANFNNTLRTGESARTLLDVQESDSKNAASSHTWEKVNLYTLGGCGKSTYDAMRCKVCEITGKRYGIGANGVTPDPQFKAKGFQSCSKSIELLERRKRKLQEV